MPAYDQNIALHHAVAADPPDVAGPQATPAASAAHASVVQQLGEVDAALADLAKLPVDARVAVFTDLHRQLTAALAITATTAPEDSPGRHPDDRTAAAVIDAPDIRPNAPADRPAERPPADRPAALSLPPHRPGPPSHRSR